MQLKLRGVINQVISVSAEVDVEETASKYVIVLGYDKVRGYYTLAVTNHYISLETKTPLNCSYKLMERGMSKADAEAVEEIVRELLYQHLHDLMG